MAVFRILEGRARPGRVDEIARMFEAQAEAVGGTRGIAFVQVLRSDDQILGVSCWRSVSSSAVLFGGTSLMVSLSSLPVKRNGGW